MSEDYNQPADMLNFMLPKTQAGYIKVMGVGGGGSNAVNHMFHAGIQGVDFIVCNTDAMALEHSPVPNKIQLGRGLGAGNIPEVARAAAIEKHDEIKEALAGTKMLFLTAGMGGGTGTGASPVVASIAKEIELTDDEVKKILTVAIVTMPFKFEGRKRLEQAAQGVEELRKTVDAILVINNDQLRKFGKMTLMDAFAMADNVLTTAAKGISEIITVKSYVQIDFKDVNTVMHDSGVALMGFGSAEGENRAKTAVAAAMDSPLLNDNSIDGAKNILLYLSYGTDAPLDMEEIDIITTAILDRTGDGADMIWGAGEDETLGSKLNITLIATGFNERTFDRTVIPGNKRQVGTIGAPKELPVQTVTRKQPVAEVQPVAEAGHTVIGSIDVTGEYTVNHTPERAIPFEEPVMESAPAVEDPYVNVDKEVEEWMTDIDPLAMVSETEAAAEVQIGAAAAVAARCEPAVEVAVMTLQEEAPVAETQAAAAPVASVAPAAEPEVLPVQGGSAFLSDRCGANAERMARLKALSSSIKSQQGLRELESVPAYQRQNMAMSPVVPSNMSEASRSTISLDGGLSMEPPFLSEKAD